MVIRARYDATSRRDEKGEKLPDTRFGSFNAKDESAPIRLANMFRVYAPSLDSSSSNEFLKYSKKNLLKARFNHRYNSSLSPEMIYLSST